MICLNHYTLVEGWQTIAERFGGDAALVQTLNAL